MTGPATPAEAAPERQVWLVRHGETEWARLGRHTGRTDIPLTEVGRSQAGALGRRLDDHPFALVRRVQHQRHVPTRHQPANNVFIGDEEARLVVRADASSASMPTSLR